MAPFPFTVGKIIRIRNKHIDGPPFLFLNTIGQGLCAHIHLCNSCVKFKPQSVDNCSIAQSYFTLLKTHSTGHAIIRCPVYVPVHESRDHNNE